MLERYAALGSLEERELWFPHASRELHLRFVARILTFEREKLGVIRLPVGDARQVDSSRRPNVIRSRCGAPATHSLRDVRVRTAAALPRRRTRLMAELLPMRKTPLTFSGHAYTHDSETRNG